MRLHLIRHAESEANIDRNIYYNTPDHNIKLTDKAKEQVAKLIESHSRTLITSSVIYTSPYDRARSTTSLITSALHPSSPPVKESPLLREQEHEMFTGSKHYNEAMLDRKSFGYYWWRFKRGESVADVHQRIVTFINNILLTHNNNDDIVVVSHEVAIRCFLQYVDNIPYEEVKHLKINNAQLITVTINKGE